eukprot:TRINITY_DN21285_c0_g1_i1.p1 TRINITY_DN21285_c0_g1~~TRINITY_DN21285_c0_g1_i1.p1  ORF type:complete len:224 (-),score=19.42 TRINITY_DN21285_c0_g1_i1:395-1066(-)
MFKLLFLGSLLLLGARADEDLLDDSMRRCGNVTCSSGQRCVSVPMDNPNYRICIAKQPRKLPMFPCRESRTWGGCCNTTGKYGCPAGSKCGKSVYQCASGVAPPQVNHCMKNTCMNNLQCGVNEACYPAGTVDPYTTTCHSATCYRNSHCRRAVNGTMQQGICTPFGKIWCWNEYLGGFHCVYPTDVCGYRGKACKSKNNRGQMQCIWKDGKPTCEKVPPPPP